MHDASDQQYYLPAGTLLEQGRYLIGLPVNAGGFGIVYRAWDQTLDRMIAVKEYFPGGVVTRQPGQTEVRIYSEKNRQRFEEGKERFLIEARVISKYREDASIVDVYDFFEANHTAYMVMEFMDGLTYKNYVERSGGHVEEQLAVNVTLAVLDALREIHKDHIVHRDINPSNIFICNTGMVKLFDFGAARIEGTPLPDTLTRGYAPPEQYSTVNEQGAVTDIYSVGATMYYALTGVKPEEATDREAKDTMKSPRQLDSQISKKVSNAVMRAMALNPKLRFQDVGEFRDALLKQKQVLDVEQEIRRRKRRRLLTAGMILAVLAGASAGSWLYMQQKLEANELRAAELQVWLSADADETEQEAEERFRRMTAQFSAEYPQITFAVTAYPSEEYGRQLNQAAADGALPDVFESTALDAGYDGMLAELDETMSLLPEPEGYVYLDGAGRRRIPLCYQLPVIYVRQGADLKAGAQDRIAVNPEAASLYADIERAAGDAAAAGTADETGGAGDADARERFVDGDVKRYYSDTSDYLFLNEKLQARYTLEFPEEQAVRFDHEWSVSAAGQGKDAANRQRAAQRMLCYLLSGSSEDILTIEAGEGIPVHRQTAETFFDVYGGELGEIRGVVPEPQT